MKSYKIDFTVVQYTELQFKISFFHWFKKLFIAKNILTGENEILQFFIYFLEEFYLTLEYLNNLIIQH